MNASIQTALVLTAVNADAGKERYRHSWTLFVAATSATAIIVHLLLRVVFGASGNVIQIPLFVALLLGGAPLVVTLTKSLLAGDFGSDFLAGISIVTAVL